MLSRIREVWAESAASSGAAEHEGVGPDVSNDRPQLVVDGSIDAAFRRAAEYGDGWIMGGGTPDMFAEGKRKLERAWSDAGRDDKPHTIALAYYSLGDDAQPNAEAYLGDYYAFLGDMAGQISGGAAKDPQTAKGYAEGFEAVGCDELIMFPSSSDPDQVDMLAEAVL